MANGILLVHGLSTFSMLGIIWFVQIVHYPLFARVGEQQFAPYATTHAKLTTRVVALPMCAELATGLALLFTLPAGVASWQPVAGIATLFLVWVATLLLSVPRHTRLAHGFDHSTWRSLCASNWIRTVTWTLRTGLVLWMLANALEL